MTNQVFTAKKAEATGPEIPRKQSIKPPSFLALTSLLLKAKLVVLAISLAPALSAQNTDPFNLHLKGQFWPDLIDNYDSVAVSKDTSNFTPEEIAKFSWLATGIPDSQVVWKNGSIARVGGSVGRSNISIFRSFNMSTGTPALDRAFEFYRNAQGQDTLTNSYMKGPNDTALYLGNQFRWSYSGSSLSSVRVYFDWQDTLKPQTDFIFHWSGTRIDSISQVDLSGFLSSSTYFYNYKSNGQLANIEVIGDATGDGIDEVVQKYLFTYNSSGSIIEYILLVFNPISNQLQTEHSMRFYQSNNPLNLLDEGELSKISFYPNPARSFLNIEGMDQGELEVYDLQGRLALQTEIREKINISSLQAGVYIVQFTNGLSTYTEKLIVR